MKAEALEKMEGLGHFQFMIWSKFKVSDELSEKSMMEDLKKHFNHSLPLKYMDFVVVTCLDPPIRESPRD